MLSRNALARLLNGTAVAALCFGVIALSAPQAAAKEFLLGMENDRSGPVQNLGQDMGQGFHDYIALFNARNGIPGHTIRVMEIDTGYNVPRGIEAYERFLSQGAVSVCFFSTSVIKSVTPRLAERGVPGIQPGTGDAGAANGRKFPWLFLASPSYWSQVATAAQFVMDNWKEERKPRIAYIFWDVPFGREPLPVLEDIQAREGFELRTFAVPSPGVEMRPQVLDITRNYRADWVIAQLGGKSVAVAFKEFSRVAFPMDRVIGLHWVGGESDINVVGWDKVEGFYTVGFHHIGSSRNNANHEIIRGIQALYKQEGKPLPAAMDASVYYNRGILRAAVNAEAIRLAVAKHGPDITGADVRDAAEQIRDFTLNGFLPPLTLSADDHEGGGYTQVFQVRNGGYKAATEPMRGYRDIVMKHVMAE